MTDKDKLENRFHKMQRSINDYKNDRKSYHAITYTALALVGILVSLVIFSSLNG